MGRADNDWQSKKTPNKINLINEDTGKVVPADVLSLTESRLIVAVAGNKITLSKNSNGAYVGRMLGMDLRAQL